MSAAFELAPHDNPFRVARIESLRFRGDSTEDLLRRFEELGRRGALVGPHGSGKSTLLRELGAGIEAAGHRVKTLSLGEARPATRARLGDWYADADPGVVLLLDGAEQLGRLAWGRVRRATRNAGGLLITTHRPGRLPTLNEHRTGPALLRSLVGELVEEPALRAALEPVLAEVFANARGNLRVALRELYDRVADG